MSDAIGLTSAQIRVAGAFLTIIEADPVRAARLLEKAERIDPSNPVVHLAIGELARRCGNLAAAAAAFERAYRLTAPGMGPQQPPGGA